MKLKILIAFSVYALIACAQKPIIWDNPNASQQQLNRDNGECTQSAQIYTPPRVTPQPEGQMVSGRYVAPSWSQQLAATLGNTPGGYSTNQNMYVGCMQSRGYMPRQAR
ncbi:hypothetical protein [Polynucleobacter brandtiae]|uniref:Lipoprotein n=1 Tax=Polynucleobacter brandtiae TaxID=1938816 RepID=A0A2M8VZ09_9BURK|nr:hypothetical protein [Polynucleobacter brandtiae]PJI83079.1 hypothetical protein B0G85_0470 [Polynucleobacter brandtiae]